jgi:glycosyltransferase involved in cell wall biosynthesis
VTVDDRALRVALLFHSYGAPGERVAARLVRELARGLVAKGHQPTILTSHSAPAGLRAESGISVVRSGRLPEGILRRRGIVEPITHAPPTVLALARDRYDVAHAFSAVDALPALVWRRLSGAATVLTCAEPPRRECLADRRLRLFTITRAVDGSDAVIAPSEAVQAALSRWLMVNARRIEPDDAPAHVRLYRELMGAAR